MSDLKAELEGPFPPGPGIEDVSAEVLIDDLNPDGDEIHKQALAELKRRSKAFDVNYGFFQELLELSCRYSERRDMN